MSFPTTQGANVETAGDDTWLKPRWFAALLGLLTLASYPGVFLDSKLLFTAISVFFSYPIAYHFRESFWHGETAAVEPAEQLRHAIPGAMEHPGALSAGIVLSALPALVVVGSVFAFCICFWGGLGMFFLARRWTHNHLAPPLPESFSPSTGS